MSRIVIIENGVVTNAIMADLAWAQQQYPQAEAREHELAGPGWMLVDEELQAPPTVPEPEPEPQSRHITRLAFRNRFTQAELITLEIAGLDDPSATMAQRQLSAAVRVMQRQVSEASYIDLDRADTRTGVIQLEAAGLLAPGRALEILDAEIQPIEIPR